MDRDPNTGYYGRHLWLPKKHINVISAKAGLEFPVMGENGVEYLQLWKDTDTHLIVPREFVRRELYPNLAFPIVKTGPTKYPKVRFKDHITLDLKNSKETIQRDAFASFMKTDRGILNLACVAGGTIINLNRGGKGFTTTIAEAYLRLNGVNDRYKWTTNIPTMIRANKGGSIGLQQVVDILYKGKRQTYVLTLRDGKTLKLTTDHEVQIEDGRFVQLQLLKPGDKVLVDANNFGCGVPTPVEIVSIEPGAIVNVYDVVCDDPFHNFVANGIVVHNCGRGKTVIALKHAAAHGVPALVVVNNTTFIDQWADRIKEFLEVQGGVGIVQGPPSTWDWEGRGIVLAMLHSLALRYAELPEGFSKYFGNIYFDEVHHLSAEVFSRACPMFYGKRFGLTATPTREDGLELVYQYHIGQIFHKYLLQELRPRVYFHQHPVMLNMTDIDTKIAISDKNGKVCLPKLRSYLGQMEENNDYISREIKLVLAKGRKLLVLSHSKKQLRILHERFPRSGICTGDEEPADRLDALHRCQVTFGTLQLVREGLDEDTLDTLFFLTPFGSTDIMDGGKNTLQQGIGRILRVRPGKKQPLAVIFDHIYIQKLHRQCGKLKTLLREWPEDEGGPFDFDTIAPYKETT
jgi:superfamily II DNA or RNA helicase